MLWYFADMYDDTNYMYVLYVFLEELYIIIVIFYIINNCIINEW